MTPRRAILALATTSLVRPALAQLSLVRSHPIRIGVLSSFTGPYADGGAGLGSVVGCQLAVEDSLAEGGPGAEVLQGDMQDKPDVGATVARTWFDRDGVQAVVDVPNSAVALAVATVALERNKVALLSGPGATAISGAQCGPNHIQWTYDTWALANGTARMLLGEGRRTWFFITADYSFGHALQADTTAIIEAGGGRVVGHALFPFPGTTDFAAPLLAAQASGADAIGLACTGSNFVNAVKQAHEFRVTPGQTLAALLCLITNVHAIGLDHAQGLRLTTPFYWDLTPATRAFTARFAPRAQQAPTMVHAGAYAATLHYLRCARDPADGATTIARMKATLPSDGLFTDSAIRPNGSTAHAMHLMQVKSPAESTGGWDYYRPLRTIPARGAFRAAADSGCPRAMD